MTMWFLLFGCVHPVPYQTDTLAGGDTTTSDEATNPTWTENTTETTTEIEETTSTDTTAPVPTCDPIIAMTTDMWLEGEMFQAQITCSGEGDLNLSEITVSGVAGLQVEHTGALSWQTNLDSSGRYDLTLSVSTPGQPDQISVWPFWVAESTDADNILANPVDYTEEWGIPVVHVTVDSNISQSYTTAEVWFYGDHYDAQIKVRGAASSGYPKNSYTIRFPNTDLNANPVGMGNKDHLVLITSFDDNSYIRQKLVYDTWADMATHANEDRLTPRTFFAVVYINNAYHGLYTACDRIDNHFVEEMGLSNGGNLYKAVSHDANFYLKSNLHAGYEKTEGSPPQGWPHAFDDLDSLVYYAGSSSAETFMDDASEWISVEEFMDWFLLVHYASAGDSAGKNSYIYHDPAVLTWSDTRFRYVPWDFNHAFGQGWYTYRIGPDVYEDFANANQIFAHLQDHPQTQAALWARFHDLVENGPLNPTTLRERVDGYYQRVDLSAQRDWQHWSSQYANYWGGSNTNDHDQERAYIYDWLEQRHEWMMSYHPPSE